MHATVVERRTPVNEGLRHDSHEPRLGPPGLGTVPGSQQTHSRLARPVPLRAPTFANDLLLQPRSSVSLQTGLVPSPEFPRRMEFDRSVLDARGRPWLCWQVQGCRFSARAPRLSSVDFSGEAGRQPHWDHAPPDTRDSTRTAENLARPRVPRYRARPPAVRPAARSRGLTASPPESPQPVPSNAPWSHSPPFGCPSSSLPSSSS